MKQEVEIVHGSGNVFVDLGFSPAEAHNLHLRSQMMIELRRFIKGKRLTQGAAAKRMKVTQPRISDLMRGEITKFSLDALVNMLADAGFDIELKVKAPSRKAASRKAA